MSISLDGFVAGPEQSREDPMGKPEVRCRPHRLHYLGQRKGAERSMEITDE
jgi:hypothetical protein